MSKQKKVFNIKYSYNTTEYPNNHLIVLDRLTEVSFYHWVDINIGINPFNRERIKQQLLVMFSLYDIENILEFLCEQLQYLPNRWEYMLLFNQTKVNSRYIQRKLKVPNSNIWTFKGDKTIKHPFLKEKDITMIRNYLLKIDFSIFDFSFLGQN